MTKYALFAGGDLQFFTRDFDYFVGIDRGSFFLLENKLPLDLAIGDFDSVSEQEFSNIKKKAKKIITAPAEKDDTDTELALKTIFAMDASAEVTIFGAFGGRLDHLMSNIFLPSDPDLTPYMSQIVLRDSQNHIQYRQKGSHLIEQVEGMAYVSFMTDGQADLRIRHAKYDLSSQNFFKKKVYSSNEFIGQAIEVAVDSGYIVIIQSKDGR
ncbi:thiamine diphosphokinase [Streptococcus didelphis]|uniref:thiamine diphosphokinase n=1 Tax=Streptococcus didelphis TaxID=102886 RepID=UPI0003683C57|nr:thiamine diphosphokinase [Streptococcus didelphis]